MKEVIKGTAKVSLVCQFLVTGSIFLEGFGQEKSKLNYGSAGKSIINVPLLTQLRASS